jgi:ATP synthase protein I
MKRRYGKPKPTAEDTELSDRLRDLDRRLDESRTEREQTVRAPVSSDRSGMAMALRMGADFVAGVVVGAAIGWGVDKLFGTSPWGLIVFVLLGFAAGVLSVLRTAGLVKQRIGGGDDFSGPAGTTR